MQRGKFLVAFINAIAMDHYFPRQNTVLECVHFGNVPAGRRFGTGGFLGIGPVGG